VIASFTTPYHMMPCEVDLGAGASRCVKTASASSEGNEYYAKLPHARDKSQKKNIK